MKAKIIHSKPLCISVKVVCANYEKLFVKRNNLCKLEVAFNKLEAQLAYIIYISVEGQQVDTSISKDKYVQDKCSKS